MDDLVLLGRWAETPLVAWPGLCDEAQKVFLLETGYSPAPFTLFREGLHEQYYIERSVEPIKLWFMSLDENSKNLFINSLYQRYYLDAAALESFTARVTPLNIVRTSNTGLTDLISEWKLLPARLAPPIFFSVLLDIWFQGRESQIEEILHTAGLARDHCANVYDIQAKREAQRIFEEVAVRVESNWLDLQFLFPDEITTWLAGGRAPVDHIHLRHDFFVTENRNGHYSIIDGDEAGERVSQVSLADLGEPQSHLEGLPAYPGAVSGPAKKILSTDDIASFNEGDILVAYQTSIWCEPLFSKARAVLTELGGVTSHAAVVCAERQVPCVVGIPNLVRSVTDGHMLSVDASNGIIEVLDDQDGAT